MLIHLAKGRREPNSLFLKAGQEDCKGGYLSTKSFLPISKSVNKSTCRERDSFSS